MKNRAVQILLIFSLVAILLGNNLVKADETTVASETYNIEFTAGDPADNNAGYFFNGAYDTLKPYLDAGTLKIPSGKNTFEQVATPAWSTDTALENFQNTLASFYSDGTVLDIARKLITRLPELRRILATDVVAAYNGDPAAKGLAEIISCYPVIKALTNYRLAHELCLLGVPLIPRMMTEMAHSETGIDIHPGAHPRNFAITPNGKFLLACCRDANRRSTAQVENF